MKKLLLSLCVFSVSLVGCAPGSLKDYRHEGESVCRDMIENLQCIENREDLLRNEPLLKKNFENLVGILIEAREFQIAHPEESLLPESVDTSDVACTLQEELERVFQIEGGKEVIERAQREAMLRLDAFEKMKEKHKELRIK